MYIICHNAMHSYMDILHKETPIKHCGSFWTINQ